MNIVIIDYKMGNVGSIINMVKKIGYKAIVSSNVQDIESADKLILPGVGAFDNGVKNLRKHDIVKIIEHKVIKKCTPILGICLGMQLFTESSEEGILHGLGWIKAKTIRFDFNGKNELKIPHMGWNLVTPVVHNCLFSGLENDARFYFVHSYYVDCEKKDNIMGKTFYGINFTSAIQKDNIFGVQFHPEKSHRFGMIIIKNFLELS